MIKTTLKASAATFILAACIAQPAVAQDAPAPTTDKPTATEAAPESENANADDGIVVVGSRIARDVFSSPAPIQMITRDESTLAGFNSTAQVLQGTAVTGGTAQINNAFGGFVTDGGPGANTISLRGLGATRTLVLLNGRRIAPAGTRGAIGSADLNVLPNAIIDRIEILKDGASSIYGSDAVAGVVNLVTRKRVSGVTLEGQYNQTGDGGGETGRISVVAGATGDRYNLTAALEYGQREALTLGDRDWSSCNTDYRYATQGGIALGVLGGTRLSNISGSGDYVDPLTGRSKCYPITATGSNGVTINTIGTGTIRAIGAVGTAAPGVLGNYNRLRPNAAVTTGLAGYEGVNGPGTIASLNVRDTFEPRILNRSLISPGKSYTGYVQGSYDLQALGNAEIYMELLGARRTSSQTGYRQLSLDYVQGSPLIPAALAGSLFSGPQATSGGRNVGVRAFIGFGNDTSSQEVDFIRVNGGIKGDFVLPEWKYDLNLMSSWSNASYTFQSFITSRLTNSTNVVSNGTGGFRCANAAAVGCVAAPALTAAVVGGNLPVDWVNYVFVPVTGVSKYKEYNGSFGLNGPIFDLPYGTVKGAFGFEYRKSIINDTPSSGSQNNDLYNLTASAPTRGSDQVWEAYGELELPLIKNVTLAKELTLSVSGRYTDYKSYGSDQTYKVGGLYSPTGWLSFRGTYGTSFRAPTPSEQFLGATTGFLAQTNDPCNTDKILDPTTPRSINCASEGITPPFQATSGITVVSLGGAAAGLIAETSTNLTVGFVFQPDLPEVIGDLSFAVDYYKIKVKNGVGRPGAVNSLNLCYDDPQFRAGGQFCRLVDPRNPSSRALTVYNGFINISTDLVRGIDYNLRYTRDLGEGQLRLNAQVTQFIDQSSALFPGDPLEDSNGQLTSPKFSGDFDASYTIKKWRLRYGLEWIDGQQSYDFYGLDRDNTSLKFHVPDYFLHNMSIRYSPDKMTITAGVRNMFDKKPPQISSSPFASFSRVGNAPLYSGYDYVGRTFFVNISKSF